MATLPGQRASFTWALNQYNLAEEEDKKKHSARLMVKYVANAPSNGFTVEQATQGQLYPDDEVAQYIQNPTSERRASDYRRRGASRDLTCRRYIETLSNSAKARRLCTLTADNARQIA